VFYSYRRIEAALRFMSFGGYQKAMVGQWFWSQRIVRILSGGMNLSRGGGNDESAEKIEVYT
jgi:hypothetical protein